jgi:hypothetical protein
MLAPWLQVLVTSHTVWRGYSHAKDGLEVCLLPLATMPSVQAALSAPYGSKLEVSCGAWPPLGQPSAAGRKTRTAAFSDWEALHRAHGAQSFMVRCQARFHAYHWVGNLMAWSVH